jgi:hypothetical protein
LKDEKVTPERIKNDPIAKEQGIDTKENPVETGINKKVVEVFANLRNFTHPQQELKDDAPE